MHTKISHTALHLFISLFISFVFIVLGKWIFSEWGVVERTALDRLRPETFKHLCQDSSLNFIKLYDIYFARVEKLMGEKYPEIYGLLGYVAFKKGKYEAAASYYKTALERNHAFAPSFSNLGVIYYRQGLYTESFKLLQNSLMLDFKYSFETIISSKRIYVPIVINCIGGAEKLPDYLRSMQFEAMRLSLFLQKRIHNEEAAPLTQEPNLICF